MDDQKLLDVCESVAGKVILPEDLPGIDISPLIDALMQFLLQLLEDCPNKDIRRAAEQAKRRPVIRLFWRMRLHARMPKEVLAKIPDAPVRLLDAGAALTDEEWSAIEATE